MDALIISPEERQRRKGLQLPGAPDLKRMFTPELTQLPKYSDFRAAASVVQPLPTVPQSFGLNNLPSGVDFGSELGWGNMFNAGTGATQDCFEAAVVHSTMYWTWMAQGTMAPFVDANARNLYEAWTGYSPSIPGSDNGTPISTGLYNWQNYGVTDLSSGQHKVITTLQLNLQDTAEVAEACYLFGVVCVGASLSTAWKNEFTYGHVWDTVANPVIVGGHFFPIIGVDAAGNFIVVTFGGLMTMTQAGFLQMAAGAYAFITADYINPSTGLSPLGYTMPQLQQYLAAMNAAL